jgi:hypothetical protein
LQHASPVATAQHCHSNHQVHAASAYTFVGSSSEQELYHLLHQDKSRLLGLVQPKDATADDVQQLLQQASALSGSLNAQAGNGCEVVVASSIWTKQWPITQEYAAAAKQLFQVSSMHISCSRCHRQHTPSAATTAVLLATQHALWHVITAAAQQQQHTAVATAVWHAVTASGRRF